jgi:hypothetical protein
MGFGLGDRRHIVFRIEVLTHSDVIAVVDANQPLSRHATPNRIQRQSRAGRRTAPSPKSGLRA